MGGMLGDRQTTIPAMLIIKNRTLTEEAVLSLVKKGISKCGKEAPRTVNLPWYVFDMHTQVGKIAASIFLKKHKELIPDRKEFESLWLCAESAHTPKHLSGYRKVLDAPSMYDCIWWPVVLKHRLSVGGRPAKECLNLWRTKWRNEMESIVHWLLEKRGNEK